MTQRLTAERNHSAKLWGVFDPYRSGMRYKKTVNGTQTLYYWDGDLLVGEKTGNVYTEYLYDESGIIGMIHDNVYYYFEKNLLGDVLKVCRAVDKFEMASFNYDPYGNIISQSGAMTDAVKIRYRGYYYDTETGFYYLQSRYYDPTLCRFISPDKYTLLLKM